MANKIGCSSNRTNLVDPNVFEYHDPKYGLSVPTEDLSILVELKTTRKARTLLTTTKDGSGLENSRDVVRVNFFEGSDVNGERVLTSRYTDLTAAIDGGNNHEALGITSIDIDFNTSYAPMVTINFIDVRGSAIFQNENLVSDDKNKYSVFFDLPYPLFELTLKGYYGQPVTYCLHMVNFNSVFNSTTGNFEISCKFIGYTYAMLSDMLVGYLKVVEYTRLGAEKYAKLKAEDPKLLTPNELYTAISHINERIEGLLASDENSIQLTTGDNKLQQIEDIKNIIMLFGQDLDGRKDLSYYPIIVIDPSVKGTSFDFIKQTDYIGFKTRKYGEDVTKYIDETFNNGSNITLNAQEFANVNARYRSGITLKMLLDGVSLNSELNTKLGGMTDGSEYESTRKYIYDYVKKSYGFADDFVFDVIDNRLLYQRLEEVGARVENEIKTLKLNLSATLRAKIREDLGFDPTVRNVINVLTTAVEVFMHVLYEVSKDADNPNNTIRTDELKRVFNNDDNFDIRAGEAGGGGVKFYPWPDYRSYDDVNGLVETYLGKYGVLTNPQNVSELSFIDDLLKAFIIQYENANNEEVLLTQSQTNWFGLNPFDTRLYIDTFPYERIGGSDRNEVMVLSMLRAMLSLGYSNKALTAQEIEAVAKNEARSIAGSTINKVVLQSMAKMRSDYFINAYGFINGRSTKVLKELGDAYYYDYIFETLDTSVEDAKKFKILPIKGGFTGTWTDGASENNDTNGFYVTNYTTGNAWKTDDGGAYIGIFRKDQYFGQKAYPLAGQANTVQRLNLQELKKPYGEMNPYNAGFSVTSGTYGQQEMFNLDYNDATLDGLPLRFVFFADGNYGSNQYNKSNGLGYSRRASSVSPDKLNKTPFDLGGTQVVCPKSMIDVVRMVDYYNDSWGNFWGSDDKRLHKDYGRNRLLAKQYLNGDRNVSYPYVNFNVYHKTSYGVMSMSDYDSTNLLPVSLFGSRLYHEQKTLMAKAFLYLHTFPWNGLITDSDAGWFSTTQNNTIFDKNEIMNLFGNRSGFISVPKYWAAFIGALLWRYDPSEPVYDENEYQVAGGSGSQDPLVFHDVTDSFIPTFGNIVDDAYYPKRNEYLIAYQVGTEQGKAFPNTQMTFANAGFLTYYKEIDNLILALPVQAKNEFKKVFYDFVQGTSGGSDFSVVNLHATLTYDDWKTTYDNAVNANTTYKNDDGNYVIASATDFSRSYDPVKFSNYSIIAPILGSDMLNDDFKYNFFTEIKDGSDLMNLIIDGMMEELIIANSTYKIWQGNEAAGSITEPRENIAVTKTDLNRYVNTLITELSANVDLGSVDNVKKQQEQQIFGTSDESVIKLMLYRTCKNIYDKWIAGSDAAEGADVMFQCGARNTLDTEVSKKRGQSKPRLIDSFRFVTRSFRDIGDELAINPLPVANYLRDNPNTSFYDLVTFLLSSNNFDFIPLPTYINYRDQDLLSSIFRPVPYYEAQKIKDDFCGPSFVCVYLGQRSKHLDLGRSNYTNDGFDVRCLDGTVMGLPDDFNAPMGDADDAVTFFKVSYGQQNQNIFKDVRLDQSEFAETAESLKIVDDISQKGNEKNRTLAGQNMFNVYSVRSYSVDVDMLGDAMIQPMMYFQLDNIPMYHGAYMVTRVKHAVKPNHMSTSFKGVRIRKPETPVFGVGDFYMSLLDNIGDYNVVKNQPNGNFGNSASVALPPIINTIRQNGGDNGNVAHGYITMKEVTAPQGVKLVITDTPMLLSEAADSLYVMLQDWVAWMKGEGFAGNNGTYAYLISAFRTYQQQVATKQNKGRYAATPGSSKHGWAIAVDFNFFNKNGLKIDNYNDKGEPNLSIGYNFTRNPSLKWLVENSYRYGWIIPEVLRDDSGVEEFWHFEYHGKSAACLLGKRPNVKGLVVDTSKGYHPVVRNPKNPDGSEAVYNGCDTILEVKTLDGTNDVLFQENRNITVTPPPQQDIAFYTSVLNGIGASATNENLKFMYAWRQAEGGKAAWNPLNTSYVLDGSTAYNCQNGKPLIRNYQSQSDGLKATVNTLKLRYYVKLVEGMKKNIGAYKLSCIIDELNVYGTGYNLNRVLAGASLSPDPIQTTTVLVKEC